MRLNNNNFLLRRRVINIFVLVSSDILIMLFDTIYIYIRLIGVVIFINE